MWEDFIEDEAAGIYRPPENEFEVVQQRFLNSPGPGHFPELRKMYEKEIGANHLHELVGFLEAHFDHLPTPWVHLALAELYEPSHRLAEAEYEIKKWFEHDRVDQDGAVSVRNEAYDLHIRILLIRKRWLRALDIIDAWQNEVIHIQSRWDGVLRFHTACAHLLAGSRKSALNHMLIAESFGFSAFKGKLLKLEILAGTEEDFEQQATALEEVKASMSQRRTMIRRVNSLRTRIRRALLQKLAQQIYLLAMAQK